VRTCLLGAALATLLSSVVVGQQPAVGKVGVAGVLQRSYAASKANLISEADKMPDADYSLKPGPMPEVRTFGQLFGHVAAGQFGICAAVKGVPNPMAGKTLEDFKTKSEFVKMLADSFAFCDDVFSATTDENAMQFVTQGPNEIPRAAALFGLLAHNSEMYGIGTVYLRLKGIVPPSTERANARRPGGR
jgi:DinB superfamily